MPKWFTDNPAEVWGGLDADMLRSVNRWIARAESIISTRFPDIEQRISRGVLTVEVVSSVVEEMVERAIKSDERGDLVSEELPEFKVQYSTSSGLGQGSTLFLTTDEFALLAPRRVGTRVGSMRMRRSYEVSDPTPAES